MQVTSYHLSAGAVWADALFVSALQRSDNPNAGQVRQAITTAFCAYGSQGCAERVAQEFGDHPETAVARMRWARTLVASCLGSAPGLTHNGPEERPRPRSIKVRRRCP